MPDILVPFDNSPSAFRALDLAIELARDRAGTSLHVLAVLDSVGIDTRELIDAAEIERVLAAEAAELFDPVRTRVQPTGIPFTCHSKTGTPARVIADFAREHAVAHIVMGTRGLGRIPGMLMGSVAQRVLHFAHCPVTLVK